jgi:hypothetical protein
VLNNIKKDIEQTQAVGREHDTEHFETYCRSWSKTCKDQAFAKAEKVNGCQFGCVTLFEKPRTQRAL